MKIQAAAISMQGIDFAVVLVGEDLIDNPGEADMTIDRLGPTFGGVPVVLMAQKDDGSPRYYGQRDIVSQLGGVPVDRMPWKEYTVR